MGLSDAEQQEAHLAGLVHDIGKIGLPPGLLEKEGPLNLEERRVMQTHSEIGEGILAKVATTIVLRRSCGIITSGSTVTDIRTGYQKTRSRRSRESSRSLTHTTL